MPVASGMWLVEAFQSLSCIIRSNNSADCTRIPPMLLLPKNERLALELGCAAAIGDRNSVEQWLKEGADVNKEYYSIGTPLMRALWGEMNATDAFWKNKKTICEILIKAGAQVNAKSSENGQTALMRAVKVNPDLVELLINNGADVHAQDNDGHTVMHHAAEGGFFTEEKHKVKICEILIKSKADVKTATLWGCVRNNQREAAKFLIKHGVPIQNELFSAALLGHADVAYILLKAGAQVDECDRPCKQNALIVAAEKKNEALCNMLVKHYRQTKKCIVDHHDLLLQCDSSGKRAFDYYPLECLDPDKHLLDPQHSIVVNEEKLKNILLSESDTRHCSTPTCSFTYTGEIHKGFERIGSVVREVIWGPMAFPCPVCGAKLTSYGPQGQNLPPKLIAKTPVAGACLSLAFAPDLPGFYHMESNTKYRYVTCGLAAIFTMARLEAEILEQPFSEQKFQDIQEKVMPQFKNYKRIYGAVGTGFNEQASLVKQLNLSSTCHLRIDDIGINMICSSSTFDPYSETDAQKYCTLKDLDNNINNIAVQFKKSKGPFVAHFLCSMPSHVFAISVTRNKHDEIAMYLHDGLDESADNASYMRRYIEYLYNRFF